MPPTCCMLQGQQLLRQYGVAMQSQGAGALGPDTDGGKKGKMQQQPIEADWESVVAHSLHEQFR